MVANCFKTVVAYISLLQSFSIKLRNILQIFNWAH